MFVCLCNGITNHQVTDAVDAGARTTKEVAAACGAGADCGRCRRTVRAIIDSRGVGRGTTTAGSPRS